VETYLQTKAQSLLDGVLGPERAIVRVNASLNFEQAEKTVEQFDPDNLAIVSQEQTTEKTSDNSTGTEGGGSSGGQTTRESSLINYEVNRTLQKIVSATGAIDRLTASVIVDGIRKDSTTEGGAPLPAEPRPQVELDRIGALVKAAIGFKSERNDQMEVVSIPFDKSHMEKERLELEEIGQREFYYDLAYKIAYGLAILVGLFIALRIVRKAVRTLKTLLPPAGAGPRQGFAVRKIGDEPFTPIAADSRKVKLSDQMSDVARDRPEEIAKVIKTLMVE
jgi:flagellar M-ring protein FliF